MTRQARERKPKPSKKEVADARRLKKYFVTPDWYDGKARKGCAICGKIPDPEGISLHVDHDHSIRDRKVVAERTSSVGPCRVNGWRASALYHGILYSADSIQKNKAISDVRRQLKRASVRGLLCWACNKALGRARFGGQKDNQVLIQRAADYLKQHYHQGA